MTSPIKNTSVCTVCKKRLSVLCFNRYDGKIKNKCYKCEYKIKIRRLRDERRKKIKEKIEAYFIENY